MRSLFLTLPVLALLATPATATQPSIFFIEEYDPAAEYFGDLGVTLPGTDKHPDLETQVVDALRAVSEATYIELQYGFDTAQTSEIPLWIFNDAIWPETEVPIGSGSVVFSRDMLIDAEQFVPEPTYSRSLIPYLAALAHMDLLLLHRTEEVAPLDPGVRSNLTEVLAGWWIGQQANASLADCDAITGWRCEFTGEPWNPGPYMRLGFGLRAQSLEDVLATLLPRQARTDEEAP